MHRRSDSGVVRIFRKVAIKVIHADITAENVDAIGKSQFSQCRK